MEFTSSNYDKILINFSCLLLCLIPFALLTGPFFPDLFLSIITLIFIFLIIKNRDWIYFKNNFFYFFFTFYILLILFSLTTNNQSLSLKSTIFYFRFIIFSLAVWYLINQNNKLIKIFAIALLITFMIAFADGFYQFIYNKNFFDITVPGTRMTILLNKKAVLGSYLVRLFPLLVAVYIYSFKPTKINLLFILILFIITDILIYISGERTAFGLLFVSSLFILLFTRNYRKIRLITLVFSLFTIFFITMYNPAIKERNIDYTINQIINENNEIVIFSPAHHKYFVTAWNMFLAKPIAGHGPNQFRVECDNENYKYSDNSCNTHPHNNYVQMLAETGLIGTLFPLILLIWILFSAIKNTYYNYFKKEILFTDHQICLLACFIVSLWPFLPTMNFFNNWINVVYYLPVGFFLHSYYQRK